MAKQPRFITELNGKQIPGKEGEVIRIESARRLASSRIERRISRLPDAPERRSVAHAMLMVEINLVKAFWTIARQPLGTVRPLDARRCGVDYIHDRSDVHARYKDAAGGKWEDIAPRPSLPSSKEIDQANEALDWLLLIDSDNLRKILVVGATQKRGDAGRNINWTRAKTNLPEFQGYTVRTLKHKYREALRIIVSEMTLARLG